MLVKYRWVAPHEQALNVPITYWYMGPVSLVACHRQKLGLRLLLLWLRVGEKLVGDPQIGQPVCCDVVENFLFSGVVGSVQICR
jgi:hypothetical protein